MKNLFFCVVLFVVLGVVSAHSDDKIPVQIVPSTTETVLVTKSDKGLIYHGVTLPPDDTHLFVKIINGKEFRCVSEEPESSTLQVICLQPLQDEKYLLFEGVYHQDDSTFDLEQVPNHRIREGTFSKGDKEFTLKQPDDKE